jgi:hypothetical protein
MKMNRMLAIILAVLMMLAAPAALAEGTIVVQGVGSVKVKSDRAGICLGVRETDKELSAAQSRVNEKIAAIVEVLKGMGLAEEAITTNGIGIYPNYNYDEGETISGYTASNTLYVSVADVDNTGAYIDAAFAAGANSLDYVEFSAVETDEAAAKALQLAVDSAREKAQVLADAAGMKLGGVLEIRDDGSSGYVSGDFYAKTNAAEADAGAGTGVMAGMQTVYASVSITFALEDAE